MRWGSVVSEEVHKVLLGAQSSPAPESSDSAYEGASLAPLPSQMKSLFLRAFSGLTTLSIHCHCARGHYQSVPCCFNVQCSIPRAK